jgi:polyphosphate kinase
MENTSRFFDKELSWLAFNERVLQEAADKKNAPIERVRFLGIYSSNLDEFFRVRVAQVRRRALIESAQGCSNQAQELLDEINLRVASLSKKYQKTIEQVAAQLSKNHVHLLLGDAEHAINELVLTNNQLKWLANYYHNRILRHLTPVFIKSKTDLASCLEGENTYFFVALNNEDKSNYALVEIPREDVPRFIQLPDAGSKREKYLVMLDDVIEHYLDKLFQGVIRYQSLEAYSIKLTRDAEYNLTDEIDQSLMDQMSKGLKQRLSATPVRLVHDERMPLAMQRFLRKKLELKHKDELVAGFRYRASKDFIKFPNPGRKTLEKTKLPALDSSAFFRFNSVFEAISNDDILLYYPYHKFRHFTEFIRQASYDPAVEAIYLNIYRVAKTSRIIHSLTEAVKNGKKVTVVVELRARFDEQANIDWAKFMKSAGIKVEFGIESLKIHSKLCLINRREQGQLVRYAHIGTGNFHESNAKVYTDFSFFTKHQEITQEVAHVFSFIEHSYKRFRFNHLLVSPINNRRQVYKHIEQEIINARAGIKAEITLKINNLVDEGLIKKLYAASQAGVNIRMIIRGMCSLVPGIKGLSENIKVISIVDRFLEHPRVMVFHNGGDKLVYISSADWMTRNFDQRVEVSCPIYNKDLQKYLLDILELHFKDTTKARIVNDLQDNQYVPRGNRKKLSSQIAIYDYVLKTEQAAQKITTDKLTNESTSS